MIERAIVHMDLDEFFVSCEKRNNSQLANIPLIVGGGDRGVVASCSYEARKFGVRSAMPMRMALKLCPDAKIIRGDMELYSKLSREVTQIIEEEAPLFEKASIDEHYLDITGMDRFYGSYKWATELAQKIVRETGLPISFALSVNKTVSKIGTGQAKPKGKIQIPQPDVRPFLDPLPIQKIPMLGDVTYQLLSRIGVRNIKTLAEMPVEVLQQLIGKNGIEIWKKANGIDYNPVEPYRERKSLSTERTFEQDSIDIKAMRSLLTAMCEKLAHQLRTEQWLTSCVVVKIKYANFDTETRQASLPYTAADHVIIKTAHELFEKNYQRRMRVRMLGVNLKGLVHGNYQINLFEDTLEMLALYQAMDKIKLRFGFKAVGRAETILKDNL